jgi:hypothetical protein
LKRENGDAPPSPALNSESAAPARKRRLSETVWAFVFP